MSDEDRRIEDRVLDDLLLHAGWPKPEEWSALVAAYGGEAYGVARAIARSRVMRAALERAERDLLDGEGTAEIETIDRMTGSALVLDDSDSAIRCWLLAVLGAVAERAHPASPGWPELLNAVEATYPHVAERLRFRDPAVDRDHRMRTLAEAAIAGWRMGDRGRGAAAKWPATEKLLAALGLSVGRDRLRQEAAEAKRRHK